MREVLASLSSAYALTYKLEVGFSNKYVTQHEKIGLMCTQNLTNVLP